MIQKLILSCILAVGVAVSVPSTAQACDCGATTCCAPAPVCCTPPPPVKTTFCVVDPCTHCTYTVSACLPACCAGDVPCMVGWRKGFLGRKVLTYKFACGECVEVVITPFGRTIVR